jgi:hypothetical protein
MVVAEELDEVVTTFDEIDLEIDDLPEAAADGQETAIELLDPGPVEDANEREADVDEYGKDDPVLLYLREMGAVPLLRPEEEIATAQQTEQAAEEVQRLLLKSPLATRLALWEGLGVRSEPSGLQPNDGDSSPGEAAPQTDEGRPGTWQAACYEFSHQASRPAHAAAAHERRGATGRPARAAVG